MNIKEIENYWLNSADDALDTAIQLFKAKKFSHSMFFLHLSVEKLLKALFVNHKNIEPPFGHNLVNLSLKITEVKFEKSQLELLSQISTFNIAARYDDYKQNFYKTCDKKFATKYLKASKDIIKWLKSQMK